MRNAFIALLLLFSSTSEAFLSTKRFLSSSKVFSRRKQRHVDDEKKEFAYATPDVYHPKSSCQEDYYDAIHNEDQRLVIVNGPAGTGKTLFPTQYAAQLLTRPGTKIIVTRPLICVDEELGYLPGGINQKMDPWTIPIFDVLREFFSQETINRFVAEKRIEIVPLGFMRGRTFKNTLIIGDELQNTSMNQMLMLLTRLGENSKLIITGDVNQCDHTENGLRDLISRLEKKYNREHDAYFEEALKMDSITLIEMGVGDVQRSPLVSTILDIYDNTK